MRLIHLLHRFMAPFGALFFVCCSPAVADEALVRRSVQADYGLVREAIDEAIEDEGLVISGRHVLAEMLERTGKDLGKGQNPLRHGDVVQFCSARLAWQMVEEDVALLASCPLAITTYETVGAAGRVTLVYRAADGDSPAQRARIALIERVVGRALASLPAARRTP